MTDAQAFWVLVDETAPADTCEKMSFMGLFSSVDAAKQWVADCYIGKEEAAKLEWEFVGKRRDAVEGHAPNHSRCFLMHRLTLSDIDKAI